MTVPTPEQLLSSNAPGVKLQAFGDAVEGTILSQTVKQATDPATGEKQFYRKSGDPVWQILYTLQTNLHEDADDDGRRTLYAKGQMLAAIRQAKDKTGAKEVEDGGWLRVVYTSNGEAERGLNPPKLYQADYRQPASQVLEGAVANVQAGLGAPAGTYQYGNTQQNNPLPAATYQQQPAYAPPTIPNTAASQPYSPQPAPQAPVQPTAAAQPTPEAVAALRAAGVDPAQVYPGFVG